MRGRLHQGAFFAAIPAGLVLVVLAPDARARIATLIYALTLIGLFGVSASYHLGDWSEEAYVRMRRLDHSMIFVLIAGTYTPFCLLVLHRAAGAPSSLIAVWAGAAVGVATKFYRVDLHVLSGFMYIGLGWVAVVSLPALLRGLDTAETVLLIAGGLLYSLRRARAGHQQAQPVAADVRLPRGVARHHDRRGDLPVPLHPARRAAAPRLAERLGDQRSQRPR